jgi:thioredoxin 1
VFASVISKTNKTIIETDTLTLYFSIKFNYFYNQIINKNLFVEKCKKNIAMALEITDATFEEIVLKSDKPVLVDFWAAWCGPCRMVGPIIDEVSNEYQGKAVVGKMDVDANQEFAAKSGVRNIPTVLVFNNGELVGRQVGVAQKSVYAEAIDSLL